jgi:hypothetical protein
MWDELVDKSPFGTIFATSEWLKITSEALNSEMDIFGCFTEENIVGGCPLFTKKYKKIIKYVTNTDGMMPYSGIIVNDYSKANVRKYERHQNNILKSIRLNFENLKLPYISLKNPISLLDLREFSWNGWDNKIHYTYLLDLNNLNYSRDVKRNIKKANSNEITIEKSTDIDYYFSLFKHTFEHQGLNTPVDKNYLKKIFDSLIIKDKADMFVAKTKDGEWIAAEIFIHDSNYVHRWTAATDVNLRKTGGYHLLLDYAFNYYQKVGFNKMNLMAGNTPQLTEFITGFNPELCFYLSVVKKYELTKF